MNDILLNTDGTIKVENGDLVINESSLQHQHLILQASKGCFRHYPALGVNVSDVILDESPDDLLLNIRREFKRDGMKVNSVKIIEGKVRIDAEYENI